MCVPFFHVGGSLGVLGSLRSGNTQVVQARFDAGEWLLELLVVNCDRNWAKVAVLHSHSLIKVAVDEDAESLADVERELSDRYSRSYRIVTAPSAGDGIAKLVEMQSSGEDVALLLVGLPFWSLFGLAMPASIVTAFNWSASEPRPQ